MTDQKLVIIDMQQAFRTPGSQWEVVGYDAAAANNQKLLERYAGNTIWTKFVRDPQEHGSWKDYYDRWNTFRILPDSPEWDLTIPTAEGDPVITLPTFGKWGTEMAELTAGAELVVTGAATDCCVLSTVLAAVDDGKHVTVVADACAGATEQVHEQALNLMNMLSPMVTITTTEELLKR